MRRFLRKVRHRLRRVSSRPVILMYHRVANPPFDPWDLAVSPARFQSQVEALAAERRVVPLDEFAALAAAGDLPKNAVGITFDDGYVDNLQIAMPILKRYGVPATFFICTGYVGSQVEFWWDELARLILGRGEAADCSVEIGGEIIALSFPSLDETRLASVKRWRAVEPPTGEREALYYDLWSKIQRLDTTVRETVLADLREQLGPGRADPGDLPMTRVQVSELAGEHLANIGAHSVSHSRLTDLPPNLLAMEIDESRKVCEALCGRSIRGFAYPFGDMNEGTSAAVRNAGFAWACSTVESSIESGGADPFDLPRIAVGDEEGDVLLRDLRAA